MAKVFGLTLARAKLRARLKQHPSQSDEKVALQVLLDGKSRYFVDGSFKAR